MNFWEICLWNRGHTAGLCTQRVSLLCAVRLDGGRLELPGHGTEHAVLGRILKSVGLLYVRGRGGNRNVAAAHSICPVAGLVYVLVLHSMYAG